MMAKRKGQSENMSIACRASSALAKKRIRKINEMKIRKRVYLNWLVKGEVWASTLDIFLDFGSGTAAMCIRGKERIPQARETKKSSIS